MKLASRPEFTTKTTKTTKSTKGRREEGNRRSGEGRDWLQARESPSLLAHPKWIARHAFPIPLLAPSVLFVSFVVESLFDPVQAEFTTKTTKSTKGRREEGKRRNGEGRDWLQARESPSLLAHPK
jgi:hypothetical protein